MISGLKSVWALALLTTLTHANDGTLLRRELKAGSTDEYVVKCVQTTVPGEGVPGDPHTVKINWNAAYHVDTVDPEKGAVLKVNVTDFSFTAEGAHVGAMPPKTRTAKGTLSVRNKIDAKTEGDNPLATNLMWLLTDFIELPEKEVSVGDTWDVTLPPSIPLGQAKVTLPAKLAGEDTFEGHPVWVVTVEKKGVSTENKVKLQLGPTGETREGKITGKADVSMKVLLEKGTGRTLQVTSKVHASQEMEIEDSPAPTPSTIDYTSTMKLKGAG